MRRGKQPGRRRSPPHSSFSPLSVCVLPVGSSRCTRCSERTTSLARSPTYGSPPYVWGEMHCWYGPRPVPRGKSNARISRLSFVLLFTCGQCIAMNSCECSTTNTHSPSFRWGIRFLFERHHRSSMLNLSIRRDFRSVDCIHLQSLVPVVSRV